MQSLFHVNQKKLSSSSILQIHSEEWFRQEDLTVHAGSKAMAEVLRFGRSSQLLWDKACGKMKKTTKNHSIFYIDSHEFFSTPIIGPSCTERQPVPSSPLTISFAQTARHMGQEVTGVNLQNPPYA